MLENVLPDAALVVDAVLLVVELDTAVFADIDEIVWLVPSPVVAAGVVNCICMPPGFNMKLRDTAKCLEPQENFWLVKCPSQTKAPLTGRNSSSTDQTLRNEARELTDMLDHGFFFSDNSKETEPKLSPFRMIPAIERLCVIPDACTDQERQRTLTSGGASKNSHARPHRAGFGPRRTCRREPLNDRT
ncbi:hypothetical protein ADM96_32485 [Burkholderia sp. ST111]|nr:hypothetical protein ADM96_32485 [Burkholderia sp. ST111]